MTIPFFLRIHWRMFCFASTFMLFGLERKKFALRSRALVIGRYLISLKGVTDINQRLNVASNQSMFNSKKVLIICNDSEKPRRQNTTDLLNGFMSLEKIGFKVETLTPNRFGHLPGLSGSFDCVVVLYDVLELRTTPWWHNFVVSLIELRESLKVGRFVVLVQDDYTACALTDHLLCCVKPEVVFSGASESAEVLYPMFRKNGGVVQACLTGYALSDSTGQFILNWKAFSNRYWDIGTRVRSLEGVFGKRGYEKADQAIQIEKSAFALNMSTNISTDPDHVFLGLAWMEFLSNCRSVPSTSGGSSLVDKQGIVTSLVLRYQSSGRVWDSNYLGWLGRAMVFEKDIPGFSPRIFEAAAAGCVLLLDENSHVLDLVKDEDFVSIDSDVTASLQKLKDLLGQSEKADQMRRNAFKKLIQSGTYSIERFVSSVVDRCDSKSNFCK